MISVAVHIVFFFVLGLSMQAKVAESPATTEPAMMEEAPKEIPPLQPLSEKEEEAPLV